MKKLAILLLLLAGFAFGESPGVTPMGPNITACLKWSSAYFCKKFFGTYTQAINEGIFCQTQNGGDGYGLSSHYTSNPNYPPTPYYAIYWMKCLEYEYGGIKPSGGIIAAQVSAVLQSVFDHPIHVSEFLDGLEGMVRIYVADDQDGTFYESLWNAEGEMLDLRAIDPETDELLRLTLEDRGLSFAPLTLP